jgi:hypothetical protein
MQHQFQQCPASKSFCARHLTDVVRSHLDRCRISSRGLLQSILNQEDQNNTPNFCGNVWKCHLVIEDAVILWDLDRQKMPEMEVENTTGSCRAESKGQQEANMSVRHGTMSSNEIHSIYHTLGAPFS